MIWHNRRKPNKEHGFALILVLALITVATAAAAQWLRAGGITLKRTELALHQQQARWAAHGLANLGCTLLTKAREQAGDQWLNIQPQIAQQPIIFPLDNGIGSVEARVYPLSGRFNLNNLLGENAENQQIFFKNILENNGWRADEAQSTLNALLDWLDADSESRLPGGAEDDYYGAQPTPYRAANQPLHSLAELPQIRGFNGQETNPETQAKRWQFVRENFSALPMGNKIDVNNATPALLASLTKPAISSEMIAKWRAEMPYLKPDDFTNKPELTNSAFKSLLTVEPSFWLADGAATVGNSRAKLYIVMQFPPEQACTTLKIGEDVYAFPDQINENLSIANQNSANPP